jgi:hypothetical protein
MNNRPTPETDAFSGKLEDWINFAEKLERERDEWRKKLELSVDAVEVAARLARAESERDEAIKQIHEEARDYELQIRKLCEAYNDLGEQNAKLREIAEMAINFDQYRAPYFAYPNPTWKKMREQLNQTKEEVK